MWFQNDCKNPSLNHCRHQGCLNRVILPLADYPNNTEANFKEHDFCCVRNCFSGSKCDPGKGKCDLDSDCKSGLICNATTETCICPECTGINTECKWKSNKFMCVCKKGYEGEPSEGCYDIDECTKWGIYACTEDPKEGIPDKACLNWPGTYACADSAIAYHNSKDWSMISALDRDSYEDSLTNCQNHGLPHFDGRFPISGEYVNDYFISCGGWSNTKCDVVNLKNMHKQEWHHLKKRREYMSITHVDGSLYAFGGQDNEGDKTCHKSMEKRDMSKNEGWYESVDWPEDYGKSVLVKIKAT